jgi:hypothetical protein
MKDNGWETCETAPADRSGRMEPSTKANGGTIKRKEKENSHIRMEITMKDNGRTIRPMATASSFT